QVSDSNMQGKLSIPHPGFWELMMFHLTCPKGCIILLKILFNEYAKKVARAEQTCALGSAMAASVVGSVYNRIEEAQEAMGSGFESEYVPDPENAKKYEILYKKYSKLGEFGEENS
ncbi:MAG: hypothetical protein KAT38_07190, partial [Bacteroidales bacterium]|nr:hypothetical protein [Bacteroidales bacterium]